MYPPKQQMMQQKAQQNRGGGPFGAMGRAVGGMFGGGSKPPQQQVFQQQRAPSMSSMQPNRGIGPSMRVPGIGMNNDGAMRDGPGNMRGAPIWGNNSPYANRMGMNNGGMKPPSFAQQGTPEYNNRANVNPWQGNMPGFGSGGMQRGPDPMMQPHRPPTMSPEQIEASTRYFREPNQQGGGIGPSLGGMQQMLQQQNSQQQPPDQPPQGRMPDFLNAGSQMMGQFGGGQPLNHGYGRGY